MLVQTQNGQIICNMDYLLSIRMEEKVGMSLLTAIPVSGDEISLGIFSSSGKWNTIWAIMIDGSCTSLGIFKSADQCRKVLDDSEHVVGDVFHMPPKYINS